MIYQIAQMFNDKNKINADLNEARETIKNMFYKKYFEPVVSIMQKEREELNMNEPKEIKLLKALQPFLNQNERFLVNKIKDYIILSTIIHKFSSEIKIAQQENGSEHKDGIYDLDNDCLADKNNNFMTTVLICALTGFLF